MHIKAALGIWLLAVTLAWMAVAPSDPGLSPMIAAQGAAPGWWQLRQHVLYLCGLWSISLMVLVMIRLVRRMTGSTLLGCTAGLLLCFDGLHFVLSRAALLDIFVEWDKAVYLSYFVVGGILTIAGWLLMSKRHGTDA